MPPPHISVQQEPNMLGEMYNVLQQMKTESDRLVESTRKHTSGLADVSLDYTRNQDHRSDRSSVQSWRPPMVPTSRGDNQSESSHSPDRYRGNHHHQPTIHSRRRRRPATTQRRRDHYDRYYSPSDESDEYSQTEVDEPQVAHSSHEDRLDVNRRQPPRVPPIRQGINMDRQQDRRYFMEMYKSLKYTGKTSWKVFYAK